MKNILIKILFTVLLLGLISAFWGCDFGKRDKQDALDHETTSSWDDTTQDGTQPNFEDDSANQAEPEVSEEDLALINQWREDYNLGTCKILGGNVSVILFYVDDFESTWTNEEINRFAKNEVEPGLLFLEQEAKKYGIELNLTVERSYSAIYYDDEVITSVKNTGFASADVLWQSALQINYPSSTKMIDAFRSRYKTEEIVCFTIFNKDGTSYALNPKRDADVKIDEHCIVFARDLYSTQNGPAGSQAAVIAHEMLHLYGAEDFYASSSRKNLAKTYYPKDIMLSAAYDIDTNTVESATAFYIGWIDTVPDVLKQKGW